MLITDKLLLSYQRCNLRAFLDILGDWKQQDPPSDFLLKLMRDSSTYQQQTLESETYEQPYYPRGDWAAGAAATLSLMQQGVDRIYRGVLCQDELGKTNGETASISGIDGQYLPDIGEIPETSVHLSSSILHSSEITLVSRPHLLIKQPGDSNFGNWSYATADMWLSKKPKLDYQIIAAFHAKVLASMQGTMPETAWLMLRTKGLWAVNLYQRMPQMFQILDECIEMLENRQKPEVFISRQKCTLCGWYTACHEEAESIKHLSLLPGVTAKRYAILKVLGLTDLASLANANSDLLASYPEFVAGVAVDVVQQARSTLLNQPFVREAGSSSTDFVTDLTDVKEGSSAADYVTDLTDVKDRGSATTAVNQFIRIPEVAGNSLVIAKIESVKITENKSAAPSIPAPILRKKPIPYSQSVFLPIAPIELYFDIEAEPELNLDYLHGVLVVDRYNNTEKFHGFLAESPAEEGAIWEQFLELMWAYPIAPIFHFCDYEVKTFKRLAKLYNTPAYLWKPVLKRFVDIHKQVTQQAIMPVESYALKPIARWLGFDWRDAKANGAQCVCWYDDWLKTGDRDLLEAIVRYNEDDCRATYIVKDWLTNFLLSQKQ
ncbi:MULTISPECIES: TM0106 family RecB-like putative nuclease [unclassified Microcoleus]|jgi:predicted RecB family nuclease|uniref:TM0106 family RecB-like putative nuclease n=1 Tax=unclassified Microcoleus TaxID=2642155 RepID=UPI001DDFDFB5|nr:MULTISPECIES: TM0106 family RecB-like putative nuclease [unclassified Microcoleus]MCC3464512.1 TM0106 family RecB-like putative nuclease [Microcoleus sp. PH2017_06_SFM_O_A]TAE15461.1 MAG: TM0106 family RecB-like putative nuclease [Oscillatoriales cyanobacterium]MCC3410583.1 TM0106 family RecB-like putative nuclease [Microcoleus sp. PH2017_02_FOX_O_A]MCC3489228.1 TM0106 family RecB-like putative nuclease [Microcoleus sp. PH2017_16_JOR_D_A]MCC3515956.1 TM0106 family RecB-like putative nucleas